MCNFAPCGTTYVHRLRTTALRDSRDRHSAHCSYGHHDSGYRRTTHVHKGLHIPRTGRCHCHRTPRDTAGRTVGIDALHHSCRCQDAPRTARHAVHILGRAIHLDHSPPRHDRRRDEKAGTPRQGRGRPHSSDHNPQRLSAEPGQQSRAINTN